MKPILIFSYLMLLIGWSYGQRQPEAESMLQSILQAMDTQQDYVHEIECNLYPGWTSNQVVEKQSGSINRKDALLSVRFAHMEYLMTEGEMFAMDHEAKLAMLSQRPPLDPTQSLTPDLASMLAYCSAISLVDNHLELLFSEGQFARANIFFQPQKHHVEKIQLFFAEPTELSGQDQAVKPRMDILYLGRRDQPNRKADTFQLSRFLIQKDASWQLRAPWSDYRFQTTL